MTWLGIEIFRRGIWNMFRMENEQINNIGRFRAIKEAPVPIIHLDNAATFELREESELAELP